MLQSLNPLQDENSQPYVLKGRQDNDKRAGGTFGKTPGGKTPFGKQLGPSSTRKALGNITNRPSNLQEVVFPKSAAKTGLGQRKTLGDITNTTPAKPVGAPKPQLQKAVQQKASAAKNSQTKLQSLAERYAQDGVEQLAGKSKQQLDLDREARDLAEAHAKAAYFASLPAFRPPVLHWSQAMQDLDNLQLEVLEAPPSPRDTTLSLDDLLCNESPSSILPEISIGDLGAMSDLYSDDDDSNDQEDQAEQHD